MSCEFCGKPSLAPMIRCEEMYFCQPCYDIRIFVFGSNLAGRHGKGAALTARNCFGAVCGPTGAIGMTGRAYAIPTKGNQRTGPLEILSLDVIQFHCERFVQYAIEHPTKLFQLTRVGCGHAGYKNEQIAPFFNGVPRNVIVPVQWRSLCKPSGS